MIRAVALAGLLGTAVFPAWAQPAVTAVPAVDLARYAGEWHEVARLPNRFQRDCVADTTARYTPRPDGTVEVVNRCRTASGDQEAQGLAWPQDGANGARLKVSFLPAWLRALPVGRGDYWVLALDDDYRWSLVGEPSRRFLWVLARSPDMPEAQLEQVLGRARAQGYVLDGLVRQPAR